MWRGLERMCDRWKRRGEDFALRRLIGAIERSRDILDSSDRASLLMLDAYALGLARRGSIGKLLAIYRNRLIYLMRSYSIPRVDVISVTFTANS